MPSLTATSVDDFRSPPPRKKISSKQSKIKKFAANSRLESSCSSSSMSVLDVLKPELFSSSFGSGWASPGSSFSDASLSSSPTQQQVVGGDGSSGSLLEMAAKEDHLQASSSLLSSSWASVVLTDDPTDLTPPDLICESSSGSEEFTSSSSSSRSSSSLRRDASAVAAAGTEIPNGSNGHRRRRSTTTISVTTTSSNTTSIARKRRQRSVRFATEVNLRRKWIRETLLEETCESRPRHRTMPKPTSILREPRPLSLRQLKEQIQTLGLIYQVEKDELRQATELSSELEQEVQVLRNQQLKRRSAQQQQQQQTANEDEQDAYEGPSVKDVMQAIRLLEKQHECHDQRILQYQVAKEDLQSACETLLRKSLLLKPLNDFNHSSTTQGERRRRRTIDLDRPAKERLSSPDVSYTDSERELELDASLRSLVGSS